MTKEWEKIARLAFCGMVAFTAQHFMLEMPADSSAKAPMYWMLVSMFFMGGFIGTLNGVMEEHPEKGAVLLGLCMVLGGAIISVVAYYLSLSDARDQTSYGLVFVWAIRGAMLLAFGWTCMRHRKILVASVA